MCGAGECRKTGKILASFVDPRQSFGPDKIIPPSVLANAKVRGYFSQASELSATRSIVLELEAAYTSNILMHVL